MTKVEIEERAKKSAKMLIKRGLTIRQVAKEMKVSKSTVHKDITERLVGTELGKQARKVLDINKFERSIRGGLATKKKYESMKKC